MAEVGVTSGTVNEYSVAVVASIPVVRAAGG
jgi:hypothetical protein